MRVGEDSVINWLRVGKESVINWLRVGQDVLQWLWRWLRVRISYHMLFLGFTIAIAIHPPHRVSVERKRVDLNGVTTRPPSSHASHHRATPPMGEKLEALDLEHTSFKYIDDC